MKTKITFGEIDAADLKNLKALAVELLSRTRILDCTYGAHGGWTTNADVSLDAQADALKEMTERGWRQVDINFDAVDRKPWSAEMWFKKGVNVRVSATGFTEAEARLRCMLKAVVAEAKLEAR
jgi:ribonuclease HI